MIAKQLLKLTPRGTFHMATEKEKDIQYKLMVTGGCGFVASNFIHYILEKTDLHVVSYDSLVTGNKANIGASDRHTLVVGDLCNDQLLLRTLAHYKVEEIVHFGALTHVTNSFKEPGDYIRANVQGMLSIVEAVKRYNGIRKFVYVSTDEVYGDSGWDKEPKTETDQLRPTNPYSASKVGAEIIANVYHVCYGLPLCGVRMCNVYGPRQTPDKVIVKFIQQAADGRPFTLEGNGHQLRRWLYVEDACRAIQSVLGRGKVGEFYNVASSDELSVIESARIIKEVVEKMQGKPSGKFETVSIPDRPYNDRRYFMSDTKLRHLGWSQHTEFSEGIEKTVSWYLSNSRIPVDNIRILVYGSKGWIGDQFIEILKREGVEYVLGKCHLGDIPDHEVEEEILQVAPTHVASFIGRTHGPGNNTIDFLEGGPDKLTINLRDNLYGPLLLAELCRRFNIHYSYIGSGCLFTYTEDRPLGGEPFTEEDMPNYFGSSYSVVKGYTDRLMHHNPNVLNVRMRLPVSYQHNARNLITKLASYPKIMSIPNSVTVLPELLPALLDLMKRRHVGTVNLVNPGAITHEEILAMYKKYVDPSHEYEMVDEASDCSDFSTELKKKRSNCSLSTDVLTSLCPQVANSHASIEKVVQAMGIDFIHES